MPHLPRFGFPLSIACAFLCSCVPGLLENRHSADTAVTAALAKGWSEEYQAALAQRISDSGASCAAFQRLSAPEKSPIAPLARARFLQYCQPHAEAALAELATLEGDSQLAWLHPLLLQSIVEIAGRAGQGEALAKFAVARSRDLGSQREKENLLSSAWAAAKNRHLDALAEALEAELYRVSPRLNPNPPADQWRKVGDDFRLNSNWKGALAAYGKMLKNGQADTMERFKALDGIRQVQKAKFRNAGGPLQDFLAASRAASSWCEKTLERARGLSPEDKGALLLGWLQFARDHWSYGDIDTARRELQRVLALRWPAPLFRAYMLWLDGRIHANYGEWDEAAEAGARSTELLLSEVHNAPSWVKWQTQLWDDSFWAAALAARKLRAWEKSAAYLNQAVEHSANPTSKLKFSFWLAESLKDAGQLPAAREAFERLAEQDPHDFYGFLAMLETGAPLTPLPDLDLDEARRPASLGQGEFTTLVWLTSSGEQALAQRYSHVVLPPKSVQIDELVFRAYLKDFGKIWDLSYLMDPPQRTAWMGKYARLFYPEPYLELVQKAVQRNPQVDREYVYSIMRQESGFDTFSLSPAYAYGLLQLVPQAARAMQRKAGVSFEHDDELFLPATNIPLGVALMDTLVDKTHGSFILRTGGYNSSLDKMQEWKDKLFKGNVLEFLEEIPYDETRAYVRLVMRNYLMNLRLNARGSFAFPQELLKL